ncbi:MAG: sigma 54-interacting transcriptional regulator [Bradymonadales bacterium]|nr:sigma 54-interacting transcriptional regulator [Bradymonadales bacterium]
MKYLCQLTGPGSGRQLALDKVEPGRRLRIGRDETADLSVEEEHISTSHLELMADDQGWLARDLKSTNGTVVVRGQEEIVLGPLNQFTVRLEHGDLLFLGDPARPVHFRFVGRKTKPLSTTQEILAVAHLAGLPQFEDRIRQDPKRIATLYEITKRLSNAPGQPAQVGQVACEAVFDLLPTATHVVISLEERPEGEFIHFIGLDRQGESLGEKHVSKSVIREVRDKRAGVLVADAAAADPPAHSIVRLGIQTTIAAPLWVGERVTGVIEADNRASGGVFTEYDLQTLTVLAGQVSLAVENARLFSRLQAAEARLAEENIFLKKDQERKTEIIGMSAAIKEVLSLIDKVKEARVPVCIEGETGTGKELVARAIHYRSSRRHKLFVSQNCAAIPESILESELFGHVKGAFTSADRDKKGLFEMAEEGTIFLDEIAETTPAMQAKLLRVLQEGEIRPVGGVRSRNVEVRVISATNKNLEEEVDQGRFREDLYYRLKVFPIFMPPLRERREDLPLLARHLLEMYCKEALRKVPTFTPEALALLMAYRWPGNVRELQNEIQRLVIVGVGGDFVLPAHLSERLRRPEDLLEQVKPPRGGLKEMLEEVEKWLILDTLRDQGGNKTATAEVLKISREGLHKKLARYNLN